MLRVAVRCPTPKTRSLCPSGHTLLPCLIVCNTSHERRWIICLVAITTAATAATLLLVASVPDAIRGSPKGIAADLQMALDAAVDAARAAVTTTDVPADRTAALADRTAAANTIDALNWHPF